jgi:hypothetical protein
MYNYHKVTTKYLLILFLTGLLSHTTFAQRLQMLPASYYSHKKPIKVRWHIGYMTEKNMPSSGYQSLPAFFNIHLMTLGMPDEIPTGKVNVYPNPFSDFFSVRSDQPMPLSIRLSDLSGRVCIEQQITDNQTIDCHHLPSGVYILMLTEHSGKVLQITKIIKLP